MFKKMMTPFRKKKFEQLIYKYTGPNKSQTMSDKEVSLCSYRLAISVIKWDTRNENIMDKIMMA